jgi:prepilin-type processing-associated H-X9-DG protein
VVGLEPGARFNSQIGIDDTSTVGLSASAVLDAGSGLKRTLNNANFVPSRACVAVHFRLVELAAEALVLGLQVVDPSLKGLAVGATDRLHVGIVRSSGRCSGPRHGWRIGQPRLQALIKYQPGSPDITTNVYPADIPGMKHATLCYRANAGSPVQWNSDGTATDAYQLKNSTNGRNFWYTVNGVIYPRSKTKLTDITDGTTNTILLGETSAVVGRALGSPGYGSLWPWTYGYRYGGIQNGTPTGIDNGWYLIDCKIVANPINFAGKNYYLNETPFTSSHAGGVNMSFCDGSVRFMAQTTDIRILQMLATRAGGEVVALP